MFRNFLNLSFIFLFTVLISGVLSPPSIAQTNPSFKQITTLANQSASGVISADLNGDGIPDLVETYTRINPALFSVQIAKCDGTFSSPVDYNSPVNQQYAVIALSADFNRDGKADVIALTGADMLVYLGRGDGTLSPPTHTTLPVLAGLAQVADFNSDGNPDIVITSSNAISVMYGDGKGGFSAPTVVMTIGSTQGVYAMGVGDFDSDAHADIAALQPKWMREHRCPHSLRQRIGLF